MRRASSLLLVFAGGATGSLLRVSALALPVGWSEPFTLLAVNLLGAFFLGIVASSIRRADLRVFLGAGLLGGFTSYSAMIALVQPGSGFWLGMGLAVVTLVAGTAASAMGLRVGATPPAESGRAGVDFDIASGQDPAQRDATDVGNRA